MVSICDSCLIRSFSNKPAPIGQRHIGPCEICEQVESCSDIPEAELVPLPEAIEDARRRLAADINANPSPRDALEAKYGVGNVWNTSELTQAFSVHSFAAPFCFVTRKSDGKDGIVEFQHSPRFYYNFVEG